MAETFNDLKLQDALVLVTLDDSGPLKEEEISNHLFSPVGPFSAPVVAIALRSLKRQGLAESDLFEDDVKKWDSTTKGHNLLEASRASRKV